MSDVDSAADGDAAGNAARRSRHDSRQRSTPRRVKRTFAQRRRTDAHERRTVQPSRTLKNLFQERGIPAWKRDVPLLYVGDDLLFVPLLGVNRAALPEQADAAGQRVRIIWREDLLIA